MPKDGFMAWLRAAPADDVLADRFRIACEAGIGGMGIVYRTVDQTTGNTVALKVLRKTDTTSMRRFATEIEVLESLADPTIVRYIAHGVLDDGQPYLAMEWIEGESLAHRLGRGPLTISEVLTLGVRVVSALHAAHACGVIHRDIKPGNILLPAGKIDEAKVADFGLSRFMRAPHVTTEGLGIGTPGYASPEQMRGMGNIDERADLFSLGCLLFRCLTNEEAFRGDEALTIIAKLVLDEPPRTRTLRPDVPPELDELIARLLAKDRDGRPHSASEVQGALARIAPASANRKSDFRVFSADLRSSHRRRPGSVSRLGVAIAMAGAVVGSLFAAHRSRPSNEHPAPAVAAFDPAKIDAETVSRCAPAARSSLAAGLQLWRDASQSESLPKLEEATKLDPQCAAASLYFVMAANEGFPKRAEHFRHARDHRATLSDRGHVLLDAIEPWIADPPDYAEVYRRALAASHDAPDDPDIQTLAARALVRLDRFDEALAVIDSSQGRRGTPIPGHEFEAANIQIRRQDVPAALARFDRCFRVSPDSADCLESRGLLRASEGDCADAERMFRHLVAVMPESHYAYALLANVLLTSTHDPVLARGAFEQRWRHLSIDSFAGTPTPAVSRIADEYRIAMVTGDFDRALKLVHEWNDAVEGMNNGHFRGSPLLELIELLRTLGRTEEARQAAEKALREHGAWTRERNFGMLDGDIEFARLAYLTGVIDAKAFRKARDEWIRIKTPSPVERWINGFAGLPEVDAGMDPPIASGEYAQDWMAMTAETFSRASYELIRIGRFQDAVRHADAAAKVCFALEPRAYVHGQVATALAHDAAGDVPGACERYFALRSYFAKAPTSVAYKLAVGRLSALSCPKSSQYERN